MSNDNLIRQHLVELLQKGHAHMSFSEAVVDFPQEYINTKPPNVPYTFWHLIEHLRLTQWDIIDFCQNQDYKYLKWPDNYWPEKTAKATRKIWDQSIAQFKQDLKTMIKIVKDPKTDLYAQIPWGRGQTYIGEALLVADHNAYHVGELGILRQVVRNWSILKT